jgi:hypothetical protein
MALAPEIGAIFQCLGLPVKRRPQFCRDIYALLLPLRNRVNGNLN